MCNKLADIILIIIVTLSCEQLSTTVLLPLTGATFCFAYLTLEAAISTYKFSKLISIHLLKTNSREFIKRSKHFSLVLNY